MTNWDRVPTDEDAAVIKSQEGLHQSTSALTWSGGQAHVARGSIPAKPEDTNIVISPKGRVTLPLAVTAAVAIFGNSFPHGWNTGVLNAPQGLIKDFLNASFTERFGAGPSSGSLELLWAASVSIYLVGGCGGAFAAGWMADKFGRKKALLLCHIFGYISAVLFGFCKMALSFEMLIIGRLIVGFGCGAGSGLVPMYLTEIAPVNIRGAMGVLHQFALTCGILVSQAIGLRQGLGQEALWPILLAITAVPCVVSCIVLPWYPDSPRHLLVNCNDVAAAEKALRIFRGREDVSLDIDEMKLEQEQQKLEPKWSFKELLASRQLRLPLILVCSLAMCQQLSGINVVFYYSVGVFEDSGIPVDRTQYAVLGTGVINVLMTGISVPLMEKSGRRPLLLGGMILMILSAGLITVALNLQHAVHWLAYISIICIITFVIGFAIGLGSIPQFIGAELFKQGPRPPAMSLAGFLNWLANFLVAVSFPSLQMATGPYSFLIFIFFMVTFGAFLWKKLPETKNKTYDDIYRIFSADEIDDKKSVPEEGTLLEDGYTDISKNGGQTVPHSKSNETETSFITNGNSSPRQEEADSLLKGESVA